MWERVLIIPILGTIRHRITLALLAIYFIIFVMIIRKHLNVMMSICSCMPRGLQPPA